MSQVDESQRKIIDLVSVRTQELQVPSVTFNQETRTNSPNSDGQLQMIGASVAGLDKIAARDAGRITTNAGGKLCRICHQGDATETNLLISCSECSSAYHAHCQGPLYSVAPQHGRVSWLCAECWHRYQDGSKTGSNTWPLPADNSDLTRQKRRRVGSEDTIQYKTHMPQTPVALEVHKLEIRTLALERQVKDLERCILDERQTTKRKDEALVALENEVRQLKEAERAAKFKEAELEAREVEYKESLEARNLSVAQLQHAVQVKDNVIQKRNKALRILATKRQSRQELETKPHQQADRDDSQIIADLEKRNQDLEKRNRDLEKENSAKAEELQNLETKVRSFEQGFIIFQNVFRSEDSNLSQRDSTD